MKEEVKFSDLVGKVLERVDKTDSLISFVCSDGSEYAQEHTQDCCENVFVEDVIGDLADLIGSPVVKAEVVTSKDNPKDPYDESFTWTFYHVATAKAHVTIRWYGESNGYYSEDVEFKKIA